jgi:hypothetical protein
MKEFSKRGLKPRWEESLSVQQIDVAAAAKLSTEQFLPASFLLSSKSTAAQEVFVEGEKEITFITFDDSNLDQWDGIIYIRTSSEDETYDSFFETPSDDGSNWVQVSETYYPPDGGEPTHCGRDEICPVIGPGGVGGTQSKGGLKSGSKRRASILNAAFTPHSPTTGFWGRISQWWGCVESVCGWSGYLCSGWTRFMCRVGYCVGGLFGCL